VKLLREKVKEEKVEIRTTRAELYEFFFNEILPYLESSVASRREHAQILTDWLIYHFQNKGRE